MIIALARNIPYVLQSIPKQILVGDWLRDAILKCITTLQDIGFRVKGVVCDNHPAMSPLIASYSLSIAAMILICLFQ